MAEELRPGLSGELIFGTTEEQRLRKANNILPGYTGVPLTQFQQVISNANAVGAARTRLLNSGPSNPNYFRDLRTHQLGFSCEIGYNAPAGTTICTGAQRDAIKRLERGDALSKRQSEMNKLKPHGSSPLNELLKSNPVLLQQYRAAQAATAQKAGWDAQAATNLALANRANFDDQTNIDNQNEAINAVAKPIIEAQRKEALPVYDALANAVVAQSNSARGPRGKTPVANPKPPKAVPKKSISNPKGRRK